MLIRPIETLPPPAPESDIHRVIREGNIIWRPQEGPQTALITCPIFEVFYGGARGGGKTESSLGDWLEHSGKYGKDAVGVFFRRKAKQLEEVIARAVQIFVPLGARYRGDKQEFTMRNGARLKFRYLEKDVDAQEYQGHSYTRVYIEEVTNFPSPSPINLLRGTLRSAAGVPCGLRLTGNPGGPGHNWVKARYIDPAPAGYVIIREHFSDEYVGDVVLERVFIPSKITDNPLLLRNDPTYVARLRQTGSAALVEAWLKGLWDVVDGAFFEEWDEAKHVVDGRQIALIPRHAIRFRAFDWGSAKPFSVGWYALADGTWGRTNEGDHFPRGALIKYREWYGASGPNVGLKMLATDVAVGIREREVGEVIKYGKADPSIFIRNGGPSIAEDMAKRGVSWQRADNKRVPGWEQVHARLKGNIGVPMLYFFDTCVDSIRTFPVIQHDDKNAEDLDTESEDHALDETRYAVMSRPWLPSIEGNNVTRADGKMTINELVKRQSLRNSLRVYNGRK